MFRFSLSLIALVLVCVTSKTHAEGDHNRLQAGDPGGTLSRHSLATSPKASHASRSSTDIEEPDFSAKQGIKANPATLDWKGTGITKESLLKSAGASLAEKITDAEQLKARTEQQSLLYSELATEEACPSDEFLLKLVSGEVNPNLLAVDARVNEKFNDCLQRFFSKHLAKELAESLEGDVCLNEIGMKELIAKTENKLRGPFLSYMAVKQFGGAGLTVPKLLETTASGNGESDPKSLVALKIKKQVDEALNYWVIEGLGAKLAECTGVIAHKKMEAEFIESLQKLSQNQKKLNQKPDALKLLQDLSKTERPNNINAIASALNGSRDTKKQLLKDSVSAETIMKKPAQSETFNYREKRSDIENERKRLFDRLQLSPSTAQNLNHYHSLLDGLLGKATEALNDEDEAKFELLWKAYNSTWLSIQEKDNRLRMLQGESPAKRTNIQNMLRGPLKSGGL